MIPLILAGGSFCVKDEKDCGEIDGVLPYNLDSWLWMHKPMSMPRKTAIDVFIRGKSPALDVGLPTKGFLSAFSSSSDTILVVFDFVGLFSHHFLFRRLGK